MANKTGHTPTESFSPEEGEVEPGAVWMFDGGSDVLTMLNGRGVIWIHGNWVDHMQGREIHRRVAGQLGVCR